MTPRHPANDDAENEAMMLPIDASRRVVLIRRGLALLGEQRLAP
jgi:hypothetical protein